MLLDILFPNLPFFIISTLFLIHIPQYLSVEHANYTSCGKLFQCGSLVNVDYPFWGEGRPESCGYPGFELTCETDVPFIRIGPLNYRVLGIDNSAEILTIAREDLWSNLCPASLFNTTLDSDIFSYGANHQNITLFYGCSYILGLTSPLPNQFECGNNVSSSSGFSFYLTNEASANNSNRVRCKSSISIPVRPASTQSLANLTSSPNELTAALSGGFEVQWLANNRICKQCTQSGGRCGYNSDSSSFVCHCNKGSYSLTCDGVVNSSGSGVRPALVALIASLAGTGAIAIPLILAFCCCRGRGLLLLTNSKKEKGNDQNVEAFIRNCGSIAPKQYSYSEIRKITNCFSEKLGQGGYGTVYKGKLPDGRLVAVKMLSETKGNGEDFTNEVSSISKTSHFNIVTLLGYCFNQKRALIYDYMPNGSLDKFICKSGSANTDSQLEWKILHQIAVGTAQGLAHLHRDCSPRILHFDIKPQNILLDEDYHPKISDFGLAKLAERKLSILPLQYARGTAGFIAPEVFLKDFGGASHKSDVYSYGMMILEMVGVRRCDAVVEEDRSSQKYFPNWIYDHLELGKDMQLQVVKDEEEHQTARRLITVGLWCIQTNPSDRPSMCEVVRMLVASLQSLQIPPRPKPYMTSPLKMPPEYSSTTFSTSPI